MFSFVAMSLPVPDSSQGVFIGREGGFLQSFIEVHGHGGLRRRNPDRNRGGSRGILPPCLRESTFETGGWVIPRERRDRMLQEYLKKLEPRLKELDAEIEKVKAKAETSRTELKKKYREQIEGILKERKRVRSELAKLGEEGSERYEEIRKDVDRAIGDLKKGIDEIVERIRKAA
jgi:hypothetical protein